MGQGRSKIAPIWKIFRNRQKALLAVEFYYVRRVDRFDYFTGTFPKAGSAISDAAMLAHLAEQLGLVCLIGPNPNVEDGAGENLSA